MNNRRLNQNQIDYLFEKLESNKTIISEEEIDSILKDNDEIKEYDTVDFKNIFKWFIKK